MEIYVSESRDERLKRRLSKFRREWVHFQYLIKKGLHPLDIASRLTHNMFVSMQIGLEAKFPEASREEIHKKMKIIIANDRKIKKLGRRKSHGRN
jgi:hypothetical protein